jgi:hypothetical protein
MNMLLLATVYGQLFSSATANNLSDGSLLIQSGLWRYVIWIFAFIAVLPLSAWCWRRRIGGHFAPSVFFASFVIPLIVIPGIAGESIHVAPDALSVRTGFWFAPTVYDVSLRDLDVITERDQDIAQRGMPRQDTFWHFRYVSGKTRSLNLPDLFVANRKEIASYLLAHGKRIEIAQQAPETRR